MEQFKGKVWVLGDDIDTDIIIPTEYLALPTLGEKITHNGVDYEIHSLPDNLMEIINAGGLVEAMKKRNGVK